MLDAVITVENLSKRYRIGQYFGGRYQYRALRDVLTDAMHAPFRRLRARSKQRAVGSNPTAISHEPSAMSHQSSANFIWALTIVDFTCSTDHLSVIFQRHPPMIYPWRHNNQTWISGTDYEIILFLVCGTILSIIN